MFIDDGVDVTCQFPLLDPYHESVKEFIMRQEFDCTSDGAEMFQTDLNSNLIMIKNPKKEGWEDCCYNEVKSNETLFAE